MPKPSTPVQHRFWAKVNKTTGPIHPVLGRCWIWTAGTTPWGHGRLNVNGVPRYAHRLVWEWNIGAIPKGMVVKHECDNPSCVRLLHLRLDTQANNLADSRARGRWHNKSEHKRARVAGPGRSRPLDVRFWEKVDRRGENECWEWRGTRDAKDYGQIWVNDLRRKVSASIISYQLNNGAIPKGFVVRHTCDNPPCVNPRHLILGTRGDNTRDWAERGDKSNRQGERNGNAKLSDKQIAEIRARYTGVWGEQTVLAAEYGIAQAHVSRIVRGIVRPPG